MERIIETCRDAPCLAEKTGLYILLRLQLRDTVITHSGEWDCKLYSDISLIITVEYLMLTCPDFILSHHQTLVYWAQASTLACPPSAPGMAANHPWRVGHALDQCPC